MVNLLPLLSHLREGVVWTKQFQRSVACRFVDHVRSTTSGGLLSALIGAFGRVGRWEDALSCFEALRGRSN